MSDVVGTAYVRIRAVTTKLAADIKDAVDKGAAQAAPSLKKTGEDIGNTISTGMSGTIGTKAKETAAKAGEDVAKALTGGASKHLKLAGRNEINDGLRDALTHRSILSRAAAVGKDIGDKITTGMASGFRRAESAVANTLESIGKKMQGTLGKLDLSKTVGNVFEKLSSIKFTGIGLLGTVLLPLVIGAAETAIFYLSGLVAVLGEVVVAAAGAGAAIGGVFVGAAPGIALIAAALKVQTPTLALFKAQIQSIGQYWKQLAILTQTNVLPAFLQTFRLVTEKMVPALRDYSANVGLIVGDTVKWAGAVLTSQRNMALWQVFLARSQSILKKLGSALGSLADTIAPIFAALTSVGERLADDIAMWADGFDRFISRVTESGELEKTFNRWYDSAQRLFGGIADLAKAVWNTLVIGSQEAGPAMDTFRDFAQRWLEFTKTDEGKAKIADFFKSGLTVMHEVNLLLTDIIDRLFKPVANKSTEGITGVLTILRTDVLPAIANLINDITKNVSGAELGDFIKKISEFIGILSSAGFIGVYLDIINKGLDLLIGLLKSPIGPAAAQIFGFIWGLSTLANLPLIGPALKGIASGMASMVDAAGGAIAKKAGFDTFGQFLVGVEGKQGAFSAVAGGVGSLASAIGGALAGALSAVAAPVAIFLAAVAAAAAVVAGLYFAFDSVRNLIDGIWVDIQTVWTNVQKLFAGDIGLGQALSDSFDAIKNLIVAAPTWMIHSFALAIYEVGNWLVTQGAPALWHWITDTAIPGVVDALKGLGSAIWGWVTETAIPGLLDALGGMATAIWTWIQSLPGQVATFFTQVVPAFFNWIVDDAIPGLLYNLGYMLGFLVGWIVKLPAQIGQNIASAATSLVGWIKDAVPQLISNLVEWAGNVWNWIVGFVTELPGRIAGAVSAITSWLIDTIPVLVSHLVEFSSNVWNWSTNFISELPGRIADAAKAVLSWIVEAIKNLPQNLADLASKVWTWVSDFIKEIPDRIFGVWSAIRDFVTGIAGRLLEIWDDIKRIGTEIIRGLIQGLEDAKDQVWEWIKNFAGGIVKGFMDALGINSPAKELIPVGSSIVEGLQVGIDNQAPAMMAQISDLAKMAADGWNHALNTQDWQAAIGMATAEGGSVQWNQGRPELVGARGVVHNNTYKWGTEWLQAQWENLLRGGQLPQDVFNKVATGAFGNWINASMPRANAGGSGWSKVASAAPPAQNTFSFNVAVTGPVTDPQQTGQQIADAAFQSMRTKINNEVATA